MGSATELRQRRHVHRERRLDGVNQALPFVRQSESNVSFFYLLEFPFTAQIFLHQVLVLHVERRAVSTPSTSSGLEHVA